jgi:hypothetical protein
MLFYSGVVIEPRERAKIRFRFAHARRPATGMRHLQDIVYRSFKNPGTPTIGHAAHFPQRRDNIVETKG